MPEPDLAEEYVELLQNSAKRAKPFPKVDETDQKTGDKEESKDIKAKEYHTITSVLNAQSSYEVAEESKQITKDTFGAPSTSGNL